MNKSIINKYKYIKDLGDGGFANVSLYESLDDTSIKRAIKIIDLNKVDYKKVRSEVENMKKIKFGIPKIIELFKEKNKAYIVQEYIQGITLREYMNKPENINEELIINWMKEISDIMIHIHNKNLIHSDLKPENIMIDFESDNRIKIIDLGISINEGELASGKTVRYCSPEQLAGVATVKSDIYSFGITIFELLFNEIPEKISVILSKKDKLNNPGIINIIEKCIRKNPNKRYNSFIEIMKDLKMIYKHNSSYKNIKRKRDISVSILIFFLVFGSMLIYNSLDVIALENETKYNQVINSGYESVNNNNYEKGNILFNDAREFMPDRVEGYIGNMYSEYKAGNYNKVKKLWKKYSDKPNVFNNVRGNYIIGSIYFEQKDYQLAKKHLKFVYFNEPSTEKYWRDYAVVLAKTKSIKEAKEIYNKSNRNNYSEPITNYVLSEINYAESNYSSSIEAIKKALPLLKEDKIKYKGYLLYISNLQKVNDYNSSKKIIDIVESMEDELNIKNSYVLDEILAKAYYDCYIFDKDENKKYWLEKTINTYLKLIDNGYIMPEIYRNIVAIYQKKDNYQKAMDYNDEYMDKFPRDNFPKIQEIWLLINIENSKKVKDYSEVLNKFNELSKIKNIQEEIYYKQLTKMMKLLEDNNWIKEGDVEYE